MLEIAIRPADLNDLTALVALDTVAAVEPCRAGEIADWLKAGSCFVAVRDGTIQGYGVLNYNFFRSGMLELVMVAPQHRREGIGEALIRHAIAMCRTPLLWTSTNQSNAAMQGLLTRLGFAHSGTIEGLDIGDPELLYRIPAGGATGLLRR